AWDSFPLADGERLVAAPVNRRRARQAGAPTVYDFLQRMERERSRNEEARVLYVAATRAVRRLHLVGVLRRDETGAPVAPRSASPLARLWPLLETDGNVGPAFAGHGGDEDKNVGPASAGRSAAGDGGEDGGLKSALRSAPQPADDELAHFVPQLQRLVAPAIPSAWQAPAMIEAAPPLREETADALAAAVGTLTHAVLELVAADPEAWPSTCVGERQPGFERWLASRGWSPAEARSGAARVARMLATTLASADGQWVLRRRADAAAELALTRVGGEDDGTALCVPGTPLARREAESRVCRDRGQVTRVVDRSFVEDGVRWIIDYKTADLGDHADPERLRTHAGRYRAQLEAYALLFADEGLPQRLAVFYAAHGILATLEYNPLHV
ncbi:MAG: PD-(D/E)XK nuclease family protein, partial [Sulfuritalea sp.]|nr:PD-(D/E)XK nuclease family protein [Sulfuritalea sp.]